MATDKPEVTIINKELSEDTVIKIKPVHLYSFISILCLTSSLSSEVFLFKIKSCS